MIFPGATDSVGDGADQNCDGADGVDADGDGHGDLASGGDDCDDGEPAINPIASDVVGDNIDQNCDGVDGFDGDRDGFAATSSGGTDCNDFVPETFLGAPEACDGTDNDCDIEIDNKDDDGDGFVDLGCTAYAGILPITDCDDSNAAVVPNGLETNGNWVDDNCNALVDEFVLTMTWTNQGTLTATLEWNVADLPYVQSYLSDGIKVGIDDGSDDCIMGCQIDGTTDCGDSFDYDPGGSEGLQVDGSGSLSYVLILDTRCWAWGADRTAWNWLQQAQPAGCGSVIDNGTAVIPQ